VDKLEKRRLFRQLIWDYSIPDEEIEAVFDGRKDMAGHYTRNMLFRKILETYPWFTIIQLFSPIEIQNLLTDDVIEKLRIPSLRAQYEFVQKRLQEIISPAG